ncbi:hypothetical protein PHMEG_00038099 [Phytophthora megakarya]|uniref:Uncharacterized protein n=1 Tax=Phytophthora megakarya TaxID=4795 RepID=A0A225UI69_9STRA|nr:hypothetical protein PHMEG_00038099 [Phytophthora megakarya]
MAVNVINEMINDLRLSHTTVLFPGTTITVGPATVNQWNAYTESDDQELRSIHLEWNNGDIIIVDLPSAEIGCFAEEFTRAFLHHDIVYPHLIGFGASPVLSDQLT